MVGSYISQNFGKQVLVPDLRRTYSSSDSCAAFIQKCFRNLINFFTECIIFTGRYCSNFFKQDNPEYFQPFASSLPAALCD